MNAERALRIGFGFDIHRLVRANKVITERPNRKLYIGGVAIPPGLPGGGQADWVLEGHSDADVLLHAVTPTSNIGMLQARSCFVRCGKRPFERGGRWEIVMRLS